MDFLRPRGDITTVLDQVSRDEQDNTLFPLDVEDTLFTADPNRRIHPFSTSVQEFPVRGSPSFGNTFTFDLGSVNAGDLLLSVFVQVQLQHWLPENTLSSLRKGKLAYQDPNTAYVWANSMGTALIQRAELEVGDQVLEIIDGDFANIVSQLFPDVNSQFGVGTDALGRWSRTTGVTSPDYPAGPRGYVTCILPFFFQRTRLKEAFPLVSIREGNMRINITLRPFNELVTRFGQTTRSDCDDTPVGKVFTFVDPQGQIHTYQVPPVPPQPHDIRLVTYAAVLDGSLRQAYLRQPHDLLYRETQTFKFTEPLKYKTGKPSGETVLIQLPLEANGPIEEILWFIRRKGAAFQNEWTNYTGTLASEQNSVFNPYKGLLVNGRIQANGMDLVYASADYFRAHIAEKHRGGIVAYNAYIYGYSFARHPSDHQPSGSINASRLNSLRLTLEITQPQNNDEWEVTVYCMGLNWMRFQNGMVNKIFSD